MTKNLSYWIYDAYDKKVDVVKTIGSVEVAEHETLFNDFEECQLSLCQTTY